MRQISIKGLGLALGFTWAGGYFYSGWPVR